MKQTAQLLNRIIKVQELNPNLLKAQYAVRGAVMIRADKYNRMLKNPNHGLPFNDIIYCNIGNPQQLQQKPMTFNRNVSCKKFCNSPFYCRLSLLFIHLNF